jgi:oligoendopeptidase F
MTERPYLQERWQLDDLFPGLDAPELEDARKALEASLDLFEAKRGDLSDTLGTEEFKQMLAAYEDIVKNLRRLHAYTSLLYSEDTQDQATQTALAGMQQLSAQVDNRTMFFKLWWKSLASDQAEALMAASGDYRYWLHALRLQKPYTLSEQEEQVINLKDVNGSQALVTLYTTITNRYTFELEVEGERKELTREELTVYIRSSDPDLRAQAYQELHRVYSQDSPILGMIYQSIVRDWRSEGMTLRGYSSPISVRNLANDVPDEIVDTLLDVCRQNAGLFHRFFQLKAKLLGVERLRRYDVYAPVGKTEVSYDFGHAVEMVFDSFRQFDPTMASMAERVLSEHHFDSEVRPGKRSGAFCSTVTPELTPWVLQSYQGRPEDVATMAHELGHAVHSLLASEHTALTQSASLPLAETASTFGEMLLVDHLLAQDPAPEVKRDLLFRQMDDAYATIMRQAFFALFEREAHEKIHAGASVDQLNEVYLQNIRMQFGEALDLSDDFQVEWVEIPHFYFAPFYVYAYAFGQLLVLSLYRQYQETGDAFKPRYLQILRAGGSDSPLGILERAGLDVNASAFWQGGFDVLREGMDQLERLSAS